MALPILLVYPFTSVASGTSRFIIVFLSEIQGVKGGGGTDAGTRTAEVMSIIKTGDHELVWGMGDQQHLCEFKEGLKSQ
jgi:hypothetical protein